jgi:hypothetical protein
MTKAIEVSYTEVAKQATRKDPMTKAKRDAIETASNAIPTSHGGALLHTLARALATMIDGEADALRGAEYG